MSANETSTNVIKDEHQSGVTTVASLSNSQKRRHRTRIQYKYLQRESIEMTFFNKVKDRIKESKNNVSNSEESSKIVTDIICRCNMSK